MPSFAVFRLLLLVFISVPGFVSGKGVDYPVGIALGHYQLSSAYYTAHNELVHVATINSSQEWQDYFMSTWTDAKSHKPSDDPYILAMFTREIIAIELATNSALNQTLEYRSITVPSHFERESSMVTISRAASNLRFFAEGQGHQILSFHNAARLAYDLDNCKSYGQQPGCIVDDEDHFALVLQYEPDYLLLHFLRIGEWRCIPVGSKRLQFPNFGEIANRGELGDPESWRYDQLITEISDFYHEMFGIMFRQRLENMELDQEEQMSRYDELESNLVGIILGGEASFEGMNELKNVISHSFPPRYKDRFLFHINPQIVGAAGAASRARQYAIRHGISNPREGDAHDEL